MSKKLIATIVCLAAAGALVWYVPRFLVYRQASRPPCAQNLQRIWDCKLNWRISYDKTETDEQALRAFLAPKLAKFWIPDAFVFVPEIPRTSTGKMLKATLRERFREWHWP